MGFLRPATLRTNTARRARRIGPFPGQSHLPTRLRPIRERSAFPRANGKPQLHATEDDMHRAILLKPELFEEGFKPISWEKKVEPGFVDIYGEDKNGKLVIIEVKRRTATKENVLQLAKYIEPIKSKINRELRAVLVAPGLGKDVQRVLVTMGLEFKELDPKKCAEVLKKPGNSKLETFFKEK